MPGKYLNANANIYDNFIFKKIHIITIIIIIIALDLYLISLFYYNPQVLLCNNSGSTNKVIENFDVEKYVDICKNRKTNFYDLTTSKLSSAFNVSNNSDCEFECDRTNCEIFLLKDLSNSTTKKCSLFNDISRSYETAITLNCESNILPPNDYGVHNGYGFVNKHYFKDNKDAFEYIDRYLEETEYIIDDLSYISYLHKKASGLNLTNSNSQNFYDYLKDQQLTAYNSILNTINGVNNRLFDSSKNILFTDLFNYTRSHREISANILLAPKRDLSFINLIDKSINTNNNSEILNNKQDSMLTNNKSITGIYLILFIIMVLTLVLLILYSTNIISEIVLFSYFIFVILLILFINNIVKI